MAQRSAAQRFFIKDWLIYIGCAYLAAFFHLLPLGEYRNATPFPNMFFLITLFWVMRNPQGANPILITFATVCLDFLLSRPPGLWTALVLGGCVFINTQTRYIPNLHWRAQFFWALLVLIAVLLLYRLAMAVFFLPLSYFTIDILSLLLTICLSPVAYKIVQIVFSSSR